MRASELRLTPQFVGFLVVVALLGFLFTVQVRSHGSAQRYLSGQDNVTLGLLITGLSQANGRLQDARIDLSQQETRLTADLAQHDGSAPGLRQQLANLQVLNGVVPAHGPGLDVTLSLKLEAFELQDLTNALRQLGCEALAVNNRRIIARSVILEQNGKLTVDGEPLTAPFHLQAIGDPQQLADGFKSIAATLAPRGRVVAVQQPDIHVDAVAAERPLVYSSFPE
ncbi:MAG: DUF881 domain-containing protein [Candidatus Dormibacteria bacterium]